MGESNAECITLEQRRARREEISKERYMTLLMLSMEQGYAQPRVLPERCPVDQAH